VKPLIGIDFETRSDVELTKYGAMKYFYGRDAAILFLSYKIDTNPTKQWHPRQDPLDFMLNPNSYHFYAFNALFEYRAWNILGTKDHAWSSLALSTMTDVMALCGRFTYHQQLGSAGDDLNLKIRKDKRGKALMKKICMPPYNYTKEEWDAFLKYGYDDVETMYEMLHALPAIKLSDKEQQIWELTQRINLRGVPVDIKAVKQILNVTSAYKLEQNTLLPELTGGSVTKATQAARIKHWLVRKGVPAPNLQADTVEKLLERVDLSDDARTVLTLRQELGKSSTAKYQKVYDQCYEGRVYDNLRYYGANTGRWSGMGFQIHNLPRSKVTDATPIIDKFYDLTIVEDNPIQAAKSIVRGMICAPPGKMLCWADYSSIENRALAWLANDEKTLKLFHKGLDQYIDMAAERYGVPYDKVTDDQRAFGKMLILGCGYGLGYKGFQKNAAKWGVYIDLVESKIAVDAYRSRYQKVVNYWYDCKRAAINAISHPGTEYIVHLTIYKVIKDKNGTMWLRCMLPSGRAIYYNSPLIVEGTYGAEVSAMGINPYTKKWMRLKVIPGRLVENNTQALCRDVLAEGKLSLERADFKLVGSIHDEAIAEVDKDFTDLSLYCDLLCTIPNWADGLPVKAEGAIEKRYRKL